MGVVKARCRSKKMSAKIVSVKSDTTKLANVSQTPAVTVFSSINFLVYKCPEMCTFKAVTRKNQIMRNKTVRQSTVYLGHAF